MRKMVRHLKIGQQRPKLEFRVLKWVLVRNAAFRHASRYQNQIPENLHYQKLVSHTQIEAETPEIVLILLRAEMLTVQCIFLSCYMHNMI